MCGVKVVHETGYVYCQLIAEWTDLGKNGVSKVVKKQQSTFLWVY